MLEHGKAQHIEGLPVGSLVVPFREYLSKELLRSLWVGFRCTMDCLEGSAQAPSKVYTHALFAAGEVRSKS